MGKVNVVTSLLEFFYDFDTKYEEIAISSVYFLLSGVYSFQLIAYRFLSIALKYYHE